MNSHTVLNDYPIASLLLSLVLALGAWTNIYYPRAIRFFFRFSIVYRKYAKAPIASIESRRVSSLLALCLALMFLAIFLYEWLVLEREILGR